MGFKTHSLSLQASAFGQQRAVTDRRVGRHGTSSKRKRACMKNSIENAVLSLTEQTADEMGLYVVDVEYKKENASRYLRIYVDKEGGVGIDDCEAFSRKIEPMLDEKDIIKEAYSLEVSSLGADTKLLSEREFLYYIGREVDVKLYKAVGGKKEFSGILRDYEDKTAFVETDSGVLEIKSKEAVYIRLHFEF